MAVKKRTVYEVTLTLDDVEFRALRALVQNSIFEDEDDVTERLRHIIWDATEDDERDPQPAVGAPRARAF